MHNKNLLTYQYLVYACLRFLFARGANIRIHDTLQVTLCWWVRRESHDGIASKRPFPGNLLWCLQKFTRTVSSYCLRSLFLQKYLKLLLISLPTSSACPVVFPTDAFNLFGMTVGAWTCFWTGKKHPRRWMNFILDWSWISLPRTESAASMTRDELSPFKSRINRGPFSR